MTCVCPRTARASAQGVAHFVNQQLLDDDDVLVRAAEAVGVSGAEAAAFLNSDDAEDAVFRAVDHVHALGVHSIPTLLIDGRLALSGAARFDEVLAELRAAAEAPTSGERRLVVA